MLPSLPDFLKHILHECDYLEKVMRGKTLNDLQSDETLAKAVTRSLEIIGEASAKLPSDLTERYPQVPWRDICNMRNRLIHRYFGIDYDIVFDTITDDIPELKHEIVRIIKLEKKK